MNTKEDHHDEINVQLRERDVNSDEIVNIDELKDRKDSVDKKEEAAKIKYYEQMYLI